MLKLAKFAKPYWLLLVLSIALLFAQANFDLALPDYLSRIVNNGIQQGGVEDALPVAIRAREMEHALLFMSPGDGEAVLGAYTLVNQDSPDYQSRLTEYPALANEPIYVRNSLEQAELDRLNPVMAKALLAVSGIEAALADPAKAAEMGAMFGGFNLSQFPPGMDVFSMLEKMPEEQRIAISDSMDKKFSAMVKP